MSNALKITVCVIHNGSCPQLSRTLASLKDQTIDTFEVRVLEGPEFWSADRNQHALGGDYVLYLYSGSILEEEALEILSKAAQTGAGWYYFDERLFGDPHGCVEKPEFGPLGFAGKIYTGEGVLFSRETLEQMELRYDGSNFAAALMEMTISAAACSDGVHIPHPLLTRHNRREFTGAEQELLAEALAVFLEKRDPGLKSVGKSNASGLYLFPQRKQQKISFLLISDAEPAFFPVGDGHEIIRLTGKCSYIEKCLRGARQASGDILCVIDSGCTPPSRADLEKLVSYASLPCAGLVSPCLYKKNRVLYAGTFSMAGTPFQMERTEENMARLWEDIYTVRETVMPAWQFWMVKKDLLLSIAGNLPEALSPEYAVLELAFRASALGWNSLYVGDILVRCAAEQAEASGGFCDMLFRWKEHFLLDPYCPSALRSRMRETELKDVKAWFPGETVIPGSGSKKILVLTHELSLTGAPVVLTHAIPILKEAGWQVVVASPSDGVLKDAFLQEKVPVLILGDMDRSENWLQYAADFDLTLVNTVVPFRQIAQLQKLDIPVLWWLHDAKSGYENYLGHVLPQTLGENIHIFSVSRYADDAVHTYRPQYQTGLLQYGLKDEADRLQPAPYMDTGGRRLFVTVGTVIPRKGQDVLVQAIRLLPNTVREQCLFLFVGKPADPDIFRHIAALEADFPDTVRHLDAIPHSQIFSLYRQADGVICSSRDDPLPTFMAETMMVSGVCICSENTGMAGVIENGKNGFLYPNDDPEKLARCIQYVAEQPDLSPIRREARKLFEEVFTMEIFRKNLLRCVARCIGEAEHA